MPPHGPSLEPPYRFDTTVPGDGVIVARISGDLDYLCAPQLRRRLLDQVDASCRLLVVDLTGVTMLSAAAMEMLLAVDVLAAARSCELRLVASNRAVLRPLSLTGLDERLAVHGTLADALR